MILKYFTRKDWLMVAPAVALVVIQVYFDLRIPGYMNDITNALQFDGTDGDVWKYGVRMVACSVLSLASSLGAGYFAARIGADFGKTLREKQFDNVERFSLGDVDRFSSASLITRSVNDADHIQVFVARALQITVKAPLTAVWAIIMISGSDWRWTAETALAVVILMVVTAMVFLYTAPRFRRIQWLTDDVNHVIGESLEGIRVVRAYNAEGYQARKFDRANDALLRNNLSAVRAMSLMFPFVGLVMNMLTMGIYFAGAMIISDTASSTEQMYLFSDMIVFSSYAMRVINGFMMMTAIFRELPRVIVSVRRIEEVIGYEPSMKDGTSEGGSARGEVEFRDVSFRYPDAKGDAVSGITFSAHRGEIVAIIGATGCGKTTVASMIPRFYDAAGGQVLVDGIDVRQYIGEALRAKIGYVPQRSKIFSGTVRMNVNFGGTSGQRTDEDVWDALDVAQASGFVKEMPGGLDSHVSQHGTNLSGGQKQRISIARAVCRRPEIYIFDDSFSALDYATDRAVRDSLKKECRGATKIVVAQRIGTIMDADTIVVMDKGRIVGRGKHRDLLRDCPVYREIAESQLSEGELQ